MNTCGAGLLFDADKQACEFPGEVECPADPCSASTPSSPTPETPSAPTPAVTAPSAPTPFAPTSPRPRCCPKDFSGRWPDADCKRFYVCMNGVDQGDAYTPCAEGLVFDIALQTCAFSAFCPADTCSYPPPPELAPTSAPTSYPRPCPPGYVGFQSMPGCKAFYQCPEQSPPQPCGPGTLFDVDTQQCEHQNTVVCSIAEDGSQCRNQRLSVFSRQGKDGC